MPNRRTVMSGLAATVGAGFARSAEAPAGTPPGAPPPAADVPTLTIGYIHWWHDVETISLIFAPASDNGRAGAEVGVADNNTTGRFLHQNFALECIAVRTEQDPVAALNTLIGKGIRLVVTDRPAPDVLKLAEAGAPHGVTMFNAGAPDDAIREENCRANLIHTAPSNAMLADALAQYLIWKRWPRWFLAFGEGADDRLLADAYRRAAKIFGARIVVERQYKAAAGSRETDSGLIDLQKQLPVFTQDAPEYDVLVCADQHSIFADYLPYRTWDARPVAGSAGLVPTSWDPNSTEFGGKQMQDRFVAYAHRFMTALDMNSWVAVRMIGTAASYAQSLDPDKIMNYMRSPDFQLGAYRGLSLSIRSWNGQVRQAILLSDSGRAVVSMSPQPGFLHEVTVLDTLGTDKPETACKLPAGQKT
ncbi:MAG TPA: ABC transporter substrate-binding protein [Acetobacteraceae bacterium]|nr:ABC transporter substrate-binding protein [Acetobacteraceae bacterium]